MELPKKLTSGSFQEVGLRLPLCFTCSTQRSGQSGGTVSVAQPLPIAQMFTMLRKHCVSNLRQSGPETLASQHTKITGTRHSSNWRHDGQSGAETRVAMSVRDPSIESSSTPTRR